jgi:hypothetical protein
MPAKLLHNSKGLTTYFVKPIPGNIYCAIWSRRLSTDLTELKFASVPDSQADDIDVVTALQAPSPLGREFPGRSQRSIPIPTRPKK